MLSSLRRLLNRPTVSKWRRNYSQIWSSWKMRILPFFYARWFFGHPLISSSLLDWRIVSTFCSRILRSFPSQLSQSWIRLRWRERTSLSHDLKACPSEKTLNLPRKRWLLRCSITWRVERLAGNTGWFGTPIFAIVCMNGMLNGYCPRGYTCRFLSKTWNLEGQKINDFEARQHLTRIWNMYMISTFSQFRKFPESVQIVPLSYFN